MFVRKPAQLRNEFGMLCRHIEFLRRILIEVIELRRLGCRGRVGRARGWGDEERLERVVPHGAQNAAPRVRVIEKRVPRARGVSPQCLRQIESIEGSI